MSRSSEVDMLGAGVVAGLAGAGLVVVWLSGSGRFTESTAVAASVVPLASWWAPLTFGSAALLVLLLGFCWLRLLPRG